MSELVPPPNSYLVFVDESGSETMKDPGHPVFGWGGCGVEAAAYQNRIRPAWRQLKKQDFDRYCDRPLHFNKIGRGRLSRRQDAALESFCQNNAFARIAWMLTKKSHIDVVIENLSLVFPGFLKHVCDAFARTPCSELVIVLELSKRTKEAVERESEKYRVWDTLPGGIKREIPIQWCWMDKAAAEAGLELADFIAYTAGTTVRDKLKGDLQDLTDNPRFEYVFTGPGSHAQDFMLVDSIGLR